MRHLASTVRDVLRIAAAMLLAVPVFAQQPAAVAVSGRVLKQGSDAPLANALVTVEGRNVGTRTDSLGRFTIRALAPGAITIHARLLGLAPARINLVVERDVTNITIHLASNPLTMNEVVVTADRNRQVHGELGTGSVIDRDAIRNLGAASLAGVLELVPGSVLQPPGLDGSQQVSLRSVPVSPGVLSVGSAGAPRRSAQQLAAFGTQIIIDDVPVSNNANLQSLGPRAGLSFSSVAGGGVDLRRIPAATLEHVEVVRGIASSRYGDLTSGVVLVETRAGRITPDLQLRADPQTVEVSGVGGVAIDSAQTVSAAVNATRTRIAPGLRADQAQRFTLQLAHRFEQGTSARDLSLERGGQQLIADTRLDLVALEEDNPETATLPGSASFEHDRGFRLTHRLRRLTARSTFGLTLGFDRLTQNSYVQSLLLRPASPFTSALDAGEHTGKYVAGQYLAKVKVDGTPTFAYARTEWRLRGGGDAVGNETVIGAELRSEWSGGAGVQFDPEFPPVQSFDGISGYDRPRRYDSVGKLGLGALYADRTWRGHLLGALVEAQGGLRFDALFAGAGAIGGYRDAALAPRLNVVVRPTSALAIRVGAGRFAKSPSLADLAPGIQYSDIVNVNYYANNPSERLTVLTTSLFDRTNRSLGFSHLDRAEAGAELTFAGGEGFVSVVTYADALARGAGYAERYVPVLRNRYVLGGAPAGSGVPPTVLRPPIGVDTVPVLVDTPTNDVTSDGHGIELIVAFPEFTPLRLRLETQAQYAQSRVRTNDIEFGSSFADFQQTAKPRTPFWDPSTQDGERGVVTTRLVHHQPKIGLVVTGTLQLYLRQSRHDEAGTDTLSFAGYLDRQGRLTRVPAADRTQPAYADLRRSRTGFLLLGSDAPTEWLFNLQIAKSLGDHGQLTFYAFNAFDRIGRRGGGAVAPILHPAERFGVELSFPLVP